MALLCVRRYSNGTLAVEPGGYVEGLSTEGEDFLLRDAPGAFQRVNVIRSAIHADDPNAADRAKDLSDLTAELAGWRRVWDDVVFLIESNGGKLASPGDLVEGIRALIRGSGTLADQLRELVETNAALTERMAIAQTANDQLVERITALGASEVEANAAAAVAAEQERLATIEAKEVERKAAEAAKADEKAKKKAAADEAKANEKAKKKAAADEAKANEKVANPEGQPAPEV